MSQLFGTNGIRWLVESHSSEYTIKLTLTAGNFFGAGKGLALGMDTRLSSPMLYNAAISGLASAGCDIRCLGVVPTPLVQFAVREMSLDGGLMVTASHNPPEFNGLKFFAADGTEFSKSQENEFERLFRAGDAKTVLWNSVGTAAGEDQVQNAYRKAILSRVQVKRGISAVVDCANGTAIGYTPEILSDMGCSITRLNSQPDGRFPGRLPEPVKNNLAELMGTVKNQGADMGIAHDGDADRAVFVDEMGTFVQGDKSLALFAVDALERKPNGIVVTPINTSKVVQDAVEARGGRVEYTAIGSPGIARRMIENNAALGGEGNGGVIFPEHQYCRDGMMAAARMACLISRKGALSGLVAELPEYHIKSEKLSIQPGSGETILDRVRKSSAGIVTEVDGIKSEADDHWSLVRLSGTEPIVRITVESASESVCMRRLEEKTKEVRDIILSLS